MIYSKGFDRNRAIAVGRFELFHSSLGQELCGKHEELRFLRSDAFRARNQSLLVVLITGITVIFLAALAIATD